MNPQNTFSVIPNTNIANNIPITADENTLNSNTTPFKSLKNNKDKNVKIAITTDINPNIGLKGLSFPFISSSKEGIEKSLKNSEILKYSEGPPISSNPSLKSNKSNSFIDFIKHEGIESIDSWLGKLPKKELEVNFNPITNEWGIYKDSFKPNSVIGGLE